jgi:hypothetical protein
MAKQKVMQLTRQNRRHKNLDIAFLAKQEVLVAVLNKVQEYSSTPTEASTSESIRN